MELNESRPTEATPDNEKSFDPEKTAAIPPSMSFVEKHKDLINRRFHPVLLCLSEKNHGLCFKLDKSVNILGRSREVDFTIDDIRASRQHLRITYENFENSDEVPICFVEDLNSRNGTELNGGPLTEKVPLRDHDRIVIGKTVMGFYFRDEVEIIQQEQLYQSATRDTLTGLFNRHQIDARIEDEIRISKRLDTCMALILIDIDKFKSVNDTYGHTVGDKVLRHVALMTAGICGQNQYPARWGGEEFSILAVNSSPDKVCELAEELRSTIEAHPFKDGEIFIPVTVSVGLAILGEDDNAETLFQRADKCLYHAKETGRNRVVTKMPG